MGGWIDGKFDAIATYEPLKTQLINAGMHKIFDSSQIEGEIVDLLVVTDKALKESPETLQKIVNAWFMGLKHIHENSDSCQIISDYLHIKRNEIDNALKGITLTDRMQNIEMLGSKTQNLAKVGKNLVNFMLKEKIIDKNINIKPYIYSKFVQKAQM